MSDLFQNHIVCFLMTRLILRTLIVIMINQIVGLKSMILILRIRVGNVGLEFLSVNYYIFVEIGIYLEIWSILVLFFCLFFSVKTMLGLYKTVQTRIRLSVDLML